MMAISAITAFGLIMLSLLMASRASGQLTTIEVTSPGDLLNLSCGDNQTIIHWVLPDGELVQNFTLFNANSTIFQFSDNGYFLLISPVTKSAAGIYLCFNKHKSVLHYHSFKILYNPPSLLDKYRGNLITAGIAAGSLLLVMTVLSLLHDCAWEARHNRQTKCHNEVTKKLGSEENDQDRGYWNDAYAHFHEGHKTNWDLRKEDEQVRLPRLELRENGFYRSAHVNKPVNETDETELNTYVPPEGDEKEPITA